MTITTPIKYPFLLLVFFITNIAHSQEPLADYTLYPFGGSFHFKTTEETKNGNLNYIALTKTLEKKAWNIETGIGTFVDTYHVRSYIGFSDISHDDYHYGIITPLLSANCAYKGYEHSSKKRQLRCFPLLKFKLASGKGFVVKITPIPKYKDVTNGQLSFEFGYKF
jgi:hypothetical protein